MQLGDRMKAYEGASRPVLPPRMPVIIRVDGRAFHTWARRCARPFDEYLMAAMLRGAERLCEQAQGAMIAYTQSDEISVLLNPYRRYESQPWLGNRIDKLCSISASVVAGAVAEARVPNTVGPPSFDARAFVLPTPDVANYFVWRQQDAERNSVQMLARSLFSHSECHRKTREQLRVMCAEAGHPWGGLSSSKRLGTLLVREPNQREWECPTETPRFTAHDDVFARALATDNAAVRQPTEARA